MVPLILLQVKGSHGILVAEFKVQLLTRMRLYTRYCAKSASAGRLGAARTWRLIFYVWRYKLSLGADFSAIAPD